MTDFDGTLAPIVDDPSTAEPLKGSKRALAALAERYRVVGVVSGRPVTYLVQHLGEVSSSLRLAGLYGLERAKGDLIEELPEASRWRPVVSEVVAEAKLRAPAGLRIEPKGLSLTLHVREAPGLQAWVEEFAAEQSALTGLEAVPGRRSIELRPPLEYDKGTVVNEWSEGMTAVCYLGDDLGDLPALSTLERLRGRGVTTLGVAVASEESPEELLSASDLVVEGCEGALELLLAMLP